MAKLNVRAMVRQTNAKTWGFQVEGDLHYRQFALFTIQSVGSSGPIMIDAEVEVIDDKTNSPAFVGWWTVRGIVDPNRFIAERQAQETN